MKRIKIPFAKTECVIPMVSITLANGITTLAVIDSGSESTLIDKGFILRNKKEFTVKASQAAQFVGLTEVTNGVSVKANTEISFTDITGTRMNIQGDVFDLSKAMKGLEAEFHIYPNILLGSDFLQSINAKIDYEKNELVIG